MTEKLAPAAGATADAAFAAAREAFRAAGLDTPELDARVLLGHVLGVAPAAWLLHRERALTEEETRRLAGLIARRLDREPVARLIGRREFWGLSLALGAATLIPRPDTETLVEAALAASDGQEANRILDLGTGSGAILLALLSERSAACGIGIDLAEDTLRIARTNAAELGLADRAAFLRADWAAPIADGSIDLLVSNPPYIETDEIARLEPEVRRHDPTAALDGGPDGLAAYRAIAPQARRALRPGGILALEIGETQAADVTRLVAAEGFRLEGAVRRDLAGQDRVVVAVRT